jgi:hypothetical protein
LFIVVHCDSIDLSGFQLVTPPDDLLSALDGLVQLDLSNNCLTDLSALATSSTCLSQLIELVVYNNLLCRPLSPDLAAQLAPSLRRLNLAHNKLTSFEDIDRLTNLEVCHGRDAVSFLDRYIDGTYINCNGVSCACAMCVNAFEKT